MDSNSKASKTPLLVERQRQEPGNGPSENTTNGSETEREKALVRKIDIRLCSIAGILCSLDLLDSGIISSASTTSMFQDLELYGSRYSVAIFIFTIASIAFQLPATAAVRWVGPRLWFSLITFCFGLITFCTAFIHTYKEMMLLRVLLGISMSGIYPGLTYLIATYYTRQEQQLRFAYLQTGEVFILATGGIVNFGLNHLDGRGGVAGWRWMFLVQGAVACFVGLITYVWMVDLPERASQSIRFLAADETALLVQRIDRDRSDANAVTFSFGQLVSNGRDLKVYGFAAMFFLQNLVSTALSYFLPIILQSGMGFSTNKAILFQSPVYYYAMIPVILSSWASDSLRLRGPVIVFNSICLIMGFVMLGFTSQVAVRYVGCFLSTGAYISNWAALSAYYSNNVVGQWKRVFTAAVVTAFNGAGGIAGSYIVR